MELVWKEMQSGQAIKSVANSIESMANTNNTKSIVFFLVVKHNIVRDVKVDKPLDLFHKYQIVPEMSSMH